MYSCIYTAAATLGITRNYSELLGITRNYSELLGITRNYSELLRIKFLFGPPPHDK